VLNGVTLGEMLPYSEYQFDVTEILKQKGNTLTVVLEDINREFGPSNGWENYGGIIRDVYIELRDKNYIENVFFKSRLCDRYSNADISVDISAKCPSDACFQIELLLDGESVFSYTQKSGETVTARVNGVRLWSPDAPNLYLLKVSLVYGDEICDVYTSSVGFREFSCDRHRFILNGKHLFLKGVCKHEMVGDSGHCPSIAEMENDMRMIKEMGCNFVRLVHYPHNKRILDIADKLGLMVSEEPGL
jgi:beta-glucuronidase